jgi:hypothetical protein
MSCVELVERIIVITLAAGAGGGIGAIVGAYIGNWVFDWRNK